MMSGMECPRASAPALRCGGNNIQRHLLKRKSDDEGQYKPSSANYGFDFNLLKTDCDVHLHTNIYIYISKKACFLAQTTFLHIHCNFFESKNCLITPDSSWRVT